MYEEFEKQLKEARKVAKEVRQEVRKIRTGLKETNNWIDNYMAFINKTNR